MFVLFNTQIGNEFIWKNVFEQERLWNILIKDKDTNLIQMTPLVNM